MVEIPPTGLFHYSISVIFFFMVDLFLYRFPFVFLEVDIWPKICAPSIPFEGLEYTLYSIEYTSPDSG